MISSQISSFCFTVVQQCHTPKNDVQSQCHTESIDREAEIEFQKYFKKVHLFISVNISIS